MCRDFPKMMKFLFLLLLLFGVGQVGRDVGEKNKDEHLR